MSQLAGHARIRSDEQGARCDGYIASYFSIEQNMVAEHDKLAPGIAEHRHATTDKGRLPGDLAALRDLDLAAGNTGVAGDRGIDLHLVRTPQQSHVQRSCHARAPGKPA